MILLNGRAATATRAGRETANRKGALPDGIDFPVRTEQWRLQQHAALRPAKDPDELHVIEVLEPPKTLAVNRRLEIGFDDQRVTDLQLLV